MNNKMKRIEELTPEKITYILKAINTIMMYYKSGALGGEIMPEDANPRLPNDSDQNYLYFTLPMALNYQRNSYRLWESALKTFNDIETADVFCPEKVIHMGIDSLKDKLLKHKIALQQNKHPQIWAQLCQTFMEKHDGSVKSFFISNNFSVNKIKEYMTLNKKQFPYLSGIKIMNYWLYVMQQYTDTKFLDKENITVAPDTHVLQASVKLELIEIEDIENANIRETVSNLWNILLSGTEYHPIDIHTPLWLWSRNGFKVGCIDIH